MIKQRYVLGKLLGSGSCGEVYEVEDLQGEHENIAIKMSSDVKNFTMEIRIMNESYENGGQTPQVLDNGKFEFGEVLWAYLIMPSYE